MNPYLEALQPTQPKTVSKPVVSGNPYLTALKTPEKQPVQTSVSSPFNTIHKLQGGGAFFKSGTPNTLIKKDRESDTYGGLPTKKGYERADIVPVSLGGVNDAPENITYEKYPITERAKDLANKVYNSKYFSALFPSSKTKLDVLKSVSKTGVLPDVVQKPVNQVLGKDYIPQTKTDDYLKNEILPAYKSGKITLQEARVKTISFLDSEQQGIKQGVARNLPGTLSEMFASTVASVKDIVMNPLNVYNSPKEFAATLYDSTIKEVYHTDKDEIQRVKNLFSDIGNKSKLTTVEQGIKATTGAANVLFTPISAFFGAVNSIPLVGTVSKLVTLPFSLGADVGKVAFGKALDVMPVSQEVKTKLKDAVEEVGSLAGMLVVGGKLYEKGGEVIKRETPKLFKKFGETDAKVIIEKAQEKAQASVETPKPSTPFQLAHEKAQTTPIETPKIEVPKTEVKVEPKATTPFGQLHEQMQTEPLTKTPEPASVKIEPKAGGPQISTPEPLKTQGEAISGQIKGTDKNSEFTSRVFERMKVEHPELTGDLTVERMNLEKDAQKAVELVVKDKQKAYDIAMGKEKSSDVTATATNIALAEQALKEGNNELYAKLITNRSLEQTRRGQEIVAEKGSVKDNSLARYVKELISQRLEKVGKNYLGDLKENFKGKSSKERATAKIDSEVGKLETRIKQKKLDVKTALSLLDKLTCLT